MANEKRLIDADELIRAIYKSDDELQSSQWETDEIVDEIRRSPTVDAVEAVHGKWIKTYTCHGERLWGYECEQCKADSPRASNYCPNCGAKMDGDGNG